MTTANLSVGIDTTKAKADLLALRKDMEGQPHTLLLNVNTAALNTEITGWIDRKKFQITLGGNNLKNIASEIQEHITTAVHNAFSAPRQLSWGAEKFRGDLNASFNRAFENKERWVGYNRSTLISQVQADIAGAMLAHHVSINTTALTESVRLAVAAGLAGGVVRVGGVAAPASAAGASEGVSASTLAAVQRTILQTLTPAVEELSKAATAIAAVARKVGPRDTSGGTVRAANSISARNADGSTTRYSQSLDNPASALTTIQQLNAEKDALLLSKQLVKGSASEVKLQQEIEAIEARIRSSAFDQLQAQEALTKATQVAAAFARVEAERKVAASAASKGLVAQYNVAQTSDKKGGTTALNQGLAANSANVRVESALAAAAVAKEKDRITSTEREYAALQKAADDMQLGRIAAMGEAKRRASEAEAGKDRNAVIQRAEDVRSRAATAAGDDRRESLNRAEQVRTRSAQAKFDMAGAAYGPNRATYDAGMAAARAEAEKLANAHHTLVPAVNAGKEAHRAMTGAMNEAHSAARGLAGSMGAMWATYGSVVPLIAFAAIGAGLRAIYEDGKKVEYQLAFIKGLGGASVTQKQVEAATAGSMATPAQALDGLRALAQSGLTTTQALSALPDVLSLATVGEISVGEAAFAATGVLKAFGLGIGDIGRVSDVMAKSAAVSNASVQDMMAGFKYASAASSMYGASLEETGASLAMLAEKNIKGSMGGTAHMNLLKEIYTPTKKAGEAFKSLGLDMQKMQRDGLSSVEMIDKIREATNKLDSTGVRAFAAAIGGERGQRELAPLLSGGTKSLKDMQNELEKSKGFTQSIMMELQNTVEGSSARMKQAITFAFSGAFEDAKGPVQAFNNTLANAFGSPVFKSYVDSMAQGMVAATRFLVDHAEAIKNVGIAYLALKGAGVVTALMTQLAQSMAQVAVAAQAKLAVMGATNAAGATEAAVTGSRTAAERAHNLALATAIELELAKRGAVATGMIATEAATIATVASAGASTAAATAASFAARAATGLALAGGAVARGLAFLTGPVGIVIGLVMTLGTLWEVLSSKQGGAKDMQDAYANSVNNTNRVLDQEIERLRLKKYLLDHPGQSEQQGSVKLQIDRQASYISQVEAAYNKDVKSGNATRLYGKGQSYQRPKYEITGVDGQPISINSGEELKALYDSLSKSTGSLKDKDLKRSPRDELINMMKSAAKVDSETGVINQRNAQNDLSKWIEDRSGELTQRRSKETDKPTIAKIDKALDMLKAYDSRTALAGIEGTKQVQGVEKQLQLEIDKSGFQWKMPEKEKAPKVDTIAKGNLTAEIEDRKHLYERDVRNIEASYGMQDALLKARHSAGLVSTEEYEIRTELIAERHSKERVTLAQKESDDIKRIAKAAMDKDAALPEKLRLLKDSDKKAIDRNLEDARAKAALATTEETKRAAVAAINLEGALAKAQEHAQEFQMTAALRDMKALRDMAAAMQAFDIGSNQKAGPQAMQEMYGSDYIAGLPTGRMNKAQKAAIAAQKENQRRDDYENSLQKKFNSPTLKGNSAKDHSVKAGMSAYDEYTPEIVAATKEIMHAQNMLDDLNKRRQTLTDQIDADVNKPAIIASTRVDLDALDKAAVKLIANVENAKALLDSTEKMRQNSVTVRSEAAENVYKYETSPQAGLNTFWAQYRKEAADSAKVVNNVMSQSFSSMEQGLLQFVTTGKLNFGDLVVSILADAARMMASNQIKQLFATVGTSAGGGAGWLSAIGTFLGIAGGGAGAAPVGATLIPNPYSGFAKGGIMTDMGPMALRKYASGGVAYGPQVSVHGEGSLPEANVPLQDGRTIPVTLSGAGGESRSVSVNYSPTINIDSRTDQGQVVQLVQAAVHKGQKDLMQHLHDTGALA